MTNKTLFLWIIALVALLCLLAAIIAIFTHSYWTAAINIFGFALNFYNFIRAYES